MTRINRRCGLLAMAGLCATSLWAQTPDWPKAKPVTLLVAFAAGSSTDTVARALAQKLSELTGGNFIIENKGGAGGNIATTQVKRAAPDGYTVLVHSVAFAVNPSLYADAGYDALKDFVPLALGPKTPNIITVNPSVAAKTLPELVEAAKKTPMSYASSGIGTTTHLSMERLKTAAKVDITHVPYQPAAAINAVVAGHTPMASTSMPPAVPQIKAGKLKGVAISGRSRSVALPEVPTFAEAGLPGYEAGTWAGILAHGTTPKELVNKLAAEIAAVMALPDVRENLQSQGLEPTTTSPAEFAAIIKSDMTRFEKVIQAANLKTEK